MAARDLFRMESKGKSADGNGGMYEGFVGTVSIGVVLSKDSATAKRKLLAIARKKLK